MSCFKRRRNQHVLLEEGGDQNDGEGEKKKGRYVAGVLCIWRNVDGNVACMWLCTHKQPSEDRLADYQADHPVLVAKG